MYVNKHPMFICRVCGNTNRDERAKHCGRMCNKCKNDEVKARRLADPTYKEREKIYRAERYKAKKESDPNFIENNRKKAKASYLRKKERMTPEEAQAERERHSAYCKKWYEEKKAKDPNYLRYRRNRHYKSYHSISIDEYEDKLAWQDGKCAICGSEEKLLVDHNHKTGFVRGLLCGYCNFGIGNFRDNCDVLSAAIRYLTHYEKE